MAPFRWAVLGTGRVSRSFVLGLAACAQPATVTVVASRTRANAERFAAEFAVPTVAASYEAAAAAEADAVYIATPPSAHEAQALAGIAAGKAVLVEKPFAMNAAAAARIVEAARSRGVFCMEGLWTRFQPLIGAVRARLDAGDIGEIRAFRAEFCDCNRPDPAASNWDPARGGGTLMRKGVYAVSLARLFLGPIAEVNAAARIGSTGVDEDCALILKHASGAISTLRSSNRTMGSNDALIYGTKGLIQIMSPIVRPPAARLSLFPETAGPPATTPMRGLDRLVTAGLGLGLRQRADLLVRAVRSAAGEAITAPYRANGYQYEADALMRAVAAGATESELMPLDESIEVMRVIDRARAGWLAAPQP